MLSSIVVIRLAAGAGDAVTWWAVQDLNFWPLPCQFIPGAPMLVQGQAAAIVHGWSGEAVYGSAVVRWRCQSRSAGS